MVWQKWGNKYSLVHFMVTTLSASGGAWWCGRDVMELGGMVRRGGPRFTSIGQMGGMVAEAMVRLGGWERRASLLAGGIAPRCDGLTFRWRRWCGRKKSAPPPTNIDKGSGEPLGLGTLAGRTILLSRTHVTPYLFFSGPKKWFGPWVGSLIVMPKFGHK
jgi:hypothetical protein